MQWLFINMAYTCLCLYDVQSEKRFTSKKNIKNIYFIFFILTFLSQNWHFNIFLNCLMRKNMFVTCNIYRTEEWSSFYILKHPTNIGYIDWDNNAINCDIHRICIFIYNENICILKNLLKHFLVFLFLKFKLYLYIIYKKNVFLWYNATST